MSVCTQGQGQGAQSSVSNRNASPATFEQGAGISGENQRATDLLAEHRKATDSGVAGDERSPCMQDDTPQDPGDLKRRVTDFCYRHRFAMTYLSLTSIAFMTGSLFTYWLVGPQHKEFIVQNAVDQAVERLQKEHILSNVTHKYFHNNDTLSTFGSRLAPFIVPALPENVNKVTRFMRIEYKCLAKDMMMWKAHEEELKNVERKLQDSYEKKFQDEMMNIRAELDSHYSNTSNTITNITITTKIALIKKIDDDLSVERTKRETMIKTETEDLKDKQVEFKARLDIDPKVKERMGFMTLDTFGPVLIAFGFLEILLLFSVCFLFVRVNDRSAASPPDSRQVGAMSVPNNDTPQVGTGHHGNAAAAPAPVLINTNNSNLTCVSFSFMEEERSEALGRKLLQQCGNQRIRQQTYVVDSMDDIKDIPACRAALVFVEPDGREMIIEDARYHIGWGLRRHTVERLLDSGVEVFIIIFNDTNSASLSSEQLFNRKLGQIYEHAQLKKLKGMRRVFSIKDELHHHQTSLIVRELENIF